MLADRDTIRTAYDVHPRSFVQDVLPLRLRTLATCGGNSLQYLVLGRVLPIGESDTLRFPRVTRADIFAATR